MSDYEKIIKLLDGATLFLQDRANAEPAHLNEYDIDSLLDIAQVCDDAARKIEKLTSPILIMNTDYVLSKDELIKAMQKSCVQIIPRNETAIEREAIEDFIMKVKDKAWYDSDYEDYLLCKSDLDDVFEKEVIREG